jgi:hypothetical protein
MTFEGGVMYQQQQVPKFKTLDALMVLGTFTSLAVCVWVLFVLAASGLPAAIAKLLRLGLP